MRALCAALLCIALAGCQAKKSASLHIDPALESLVPSDTLAVAGADVDAIRGTAVYRQLIRGFDDAQITRLKAASKVLYCWDGKRSLFLARGKFSKADIEIGSSFDYKNYRLFGDERGAVFMLNDSTVAAGSTSELRSLIDRQGNRGLPPALAGLLQTLPATDQIYAALTGGLEELNLPLQQNGNAANVLQALRSVENAAVGIDLSHGLSAIARMNSKSERDAKFVHDMLKGLVGFGRLNTPENQPDLLKLYDAIQITQQQMQTEIKADIPANEVDRFLDLLPKRPAAR